MEEARERKGFKKHVLTYRVGDLVWVKKSEGGSKTEAKVALANEGPFEVLEVLGSTTYSVRRIGEAVSIRKKIHAENMGPYADIKEIEAKFSGLRGPYKKKVKQAPKAKSTKSKVWEVSEVVDSRGSLWHIALKEMDSFFDWRLGVRSSGNFKQRNRSLFEEALSNCETADNDTQSAHEPHATASENIDEEPDKQCHVEEQSARFESDKGKEEV